MVSLPGFHPAGQTERRQGGEGEKKKKKKEVQNLIRIQNRYITDPLLYPRSIQLDDLRGEI